MTTLDRPKAAAREGRSGVVRPGLIERLDAANRGHSRAALSRSSRHEEIPADNLVRERFSTLVLGRSTQDLVSYWGARYFEGITPPTVLSSAAAVRAYLAAEPAASAYVALAEVDDTCRVLVVLDHAGTATGGAPPGHGREP